MVFIWPKHCDLVVIGPIKKQRAVGSLQLTSNNLWALIDKWFLAGFQRHHFSIERFDHVEVHIEECLAFIPVLLFDLNLLMLSLWFLYIRATFTAIFIYVFHLLATWVVVNWHIIAQISQRMLTCITFFELTSLNASKQVILGQDVPDGTVVYSILLNHISDRFFVNAMVENDAYSFSCAHERALGASLRFIPQDIHIVLVDDLFVPLSFLARLAMCSLYRGWLLIFFINLLHLWYQVLHACVSE